MEELLKLLLIIYLSVFARAQSLGTIYDVLCNGSCSIYKYELFKNGLNYNLDVSYVQSCSMSSCRYCDSRGKWTLPSSTSTYLVRNTVNCKLETSKSFDEFFSSSEVIDFTCSMSKCSKYLYEKSLRTITYTYLGSCDNVACEKCYQAGLWISLGNFDRRTLLRSTDDNCLAPSKIDISDFYLSNTLVLEWTAGRIIAVVISFLSLITVIITLVVCFYCFK